MGLFQMYDPEFYVRCISIHGDVSMWGFVVGGEYPAMSMEPATGADFATLDAAGEMVFWGRWEDDPLVVWEKVA